MKKYFLGICIVIATLIYVWGNRWEVTNLHTMAAVLKYNKIMNNEEKKSFDEYMPLVSEWMQTKYCNRKG